MTNFFDEKHIFRTNIDSIKFGIYSSEEILAKSVVEINSTKLKGGSNTVYDPRMGNLENVTDKCITCGLMNKDCPGHFGHINLNCEIVNPRHIKTIINILKCVCINCKRFLYTEKQLEIIGLDKLEGKKRLLKLFKMDKKNICDREDTCGINEQPNYTYYNKDNKVQLTKMLGKNKESMLMEDSDIIEILQNIPDEDSELMGFDIEYTKPKNFIMSVLTVLPPCARPYVIVDGNCCDDDITNQYIEIIKLSNQLKEKPENSKKIIDNMRFKISVLFNNKNKKTKQPTNGRPFKGIEERIGSKSGQLRGHLLGKRGDQSARTVIGPEPTAKYSTVFFPEDCAKNLTVKEIVNKHNKKFLQSLVDRDYVDIVMRGERRISLYYATKIKGTKINQGDIIIRNKKRIIVTCRGENFPVFDGDKILNPKTKEETLITIEQKRKFLLKDGDVVERFLLDGDIGIINRQPTLHKGSIMGMRIKITPQKTMRFSLSLTASFNADCDGDEMNFHIAQDPQTRAEVLELSSPKNHIISTQTGKGNIKIVQDGLLGAYLLTKKERTIRVDKNGKFIEEYENTKISKNNFNNLLLRIRDPKTDKDISITEINRKRNHIRKILKKFGKSIKTLNGRSLISFIFPDTYNYTCKNNVLEDEPILKIRFGVIIEGALNKKNLGSSHQSIIVDLYKLYDDNIALTFSDNLQYITNEWLLTKGFTIGIRDCLITDDNLIQKNIEECFIKTQLVEEKTNNPIIKELKINSELIKARDVGMKIAKNNMDKDNNFISTITSGSKGDYFNITQIAGLLGQQNVTGKRIPKTLNRGLRVFPHTPFNNTNKDKEYEDLGFIKESFIDGLNPISFFVHAMTGREGITDTANKTSSSGYVQRKIGKTIEDVKVCNDGTVRDLNNNVYMFSYGGGYDSSKAILVDNKMQFVNVNGIVDKLNNEFELEN